MFSVLFLGTCACDYSPKLHNEYKDCFDKNARRSSSVLVNEQYLIDCGDHCLDELRIANVNAAKITDILLTHLHSDHYNVEHIRYIASASTRMLRVWVREDAIVPELENVEWRRMQSTSVYAIEDGLTVVGLKANHNESVFPQHLLFEKGGKKFLYACDGAWFLHETYYALKNADLSLLVLDCTCGDYQGDYRMGEHNTIPMIRVMLPSLKTWRTITENTQTYISHLAPSLHKSHEETVKIMAELGVNVAYDGLQIEI